jgi:hypothetical protein
MNSSVPVAGSASSVSSVSDDVHRVAVRPVGRQEGVHRRLRGGRQRRQLQTGGGRGVGGHHAGPAPIGQQRQPFHPGGVRAHRTPVVRQRLGGDEQVLQRVHAQHAGAADRGVEHDVGTGQRAGVRGRGLLPLRRAPGLDHQHRLVARAGAGCRHELARRLDRFDVQQHGAGACVAGQPVEHVAEVDVGALAQRHEVREADAAAARPVEQGRHQCARLRDEGQRARGGIDMRKAGVETDVRRQQAQAVGAQDAQQVPARGVEHGLLLLGRQPGGHHDGGARAQPAQRVDQPGHAGWWGADHGQFGRLQQVLHTGDHRHAVQFAVIGVHGRQGAAVSALAQVAPDGGADAARACRSADHGHRRRVEQGIEVTNAHTEMMPAACDNRLTRRKARPRAGRHHRPIDNPARSPP